MQSVSFVDALRSIVNREGISEELIIKTVEEALLAAYKKKYGTQHNAVIKVDEIKGEVYLFSRKEVVDDDDFDDEIVEISLSNAKKMNPNCEVGDEVFVEVKPENFGRIEIQTARQIVLQKLSDIKKDVLFSEYSNKIGQLVSGEYQRERSGTIFVDLGRTEAILPYGEQSPRERYNQGDRIRAIILDVKKEAKRTSIILSRASKNFIKALFELEVPEISDKIVEIMNIEREVGARTKIAVYSLQIDPVGACVGVKGVRIQNIVKELEGEKIDIIPYDYEIRNYIKNALLPAKVDKVNVVNKEEKKAVAIVSNEQLSLAIGKEGQNVKLASNLTGWKIDVITSEIYEKDPTLYKDVSQVDWHETFVEEDETHDISLLEELPAVVIEKLREVGITTIESLVEMPKAELEKIPGIGPKTTEQIYNTLKDMVEIVEEEGEKEKPEDIKVDVVHHYKYEYQCPQCNNPINELIVLCPKCGIELEFE
jgi:N utilization substance protein A